LVDDVHVALGDRVGIEIVVVRRIAAFDTSGRRLTYASIGPPDAPDAGRFA